VRPSPTTLSMRPATSPFGNTTSSHCSCAHPPIAVRPGRSTRGMPHAAVGLEASGASLQPALPCPCTGHLTKDARARVRKLQGARRPSRHLHGLRPTFFLGPTRSCTTCRHQPPSPSERRRLAGIRAGASLHLPLPALTCPYLPLPALISPRQLPLFPLNFV
jgi:hypothetical protein